ncbi:MAG: toprim domain-containing protein [Candidatus Altiarchaeales archaeon]|nr:toprim domain-containing protein [Candidatus Altiarchaeales archaeon]
MYYNKKKIENTMNNPISNTLLKLNKNYVPLRGLTAKTMAFFDVRAISDNKGKVEKLVFPYGDEAQKVRVMETKEHYAVGNMKDVALFGMDKFSPGQNMSITITEGELDAMSVFQMLGSKYPVVSVRSSTTAVEDCKNAREYLNSFSKIYLCLDNDPPGEKATNKIAALFDPNKVHYVNLGNYKDPNAFLQDGKEKEFTNVWYSSKKYIPKGIVSSWDQQFKILGQKRERALASYPFPSLQEMTYGIRSKELILITAQEKIGKTEFIRTIEHHLLSTTEENVGIIHLEEEEQRSIQGLVGIHMGQPVHLPDCMVSLSDQQEALKDLTKTDGRLNVYTHFGSDDPDLILDVLRSMVSVLGCKFVFIDHITMLVTGYEGDDERKKLDYLSTKFAELTRDLDFTMFLVSHVNDDGKTRGSRNIAKVADLIINLDRDIEAQDENTRNTTFATVRGNRFSGRTGPAGIIGFNPQSFKLSEITFSEGPQADFDFNVEEFANV